MSTRLPAPPPADHGALATPAAPSAQAAADRAADPRRWRALAVLLLVQFMIILDVSAVNIALPTIQGDLGFSRAGLTWVVDSYVLVAGSLLLFGGRLGDVFGRRRAFLVGGAVFGAASLLAGAAQNPATLVSARIAQGLGEALAAPAAFGLLAVLFTNPAERVKAIGLFGGISGLAGTTGPIVSGALVEYASWRWIFLVNIPVALVALVAVPRLVRGDVGRDRSAQPRLDVLGAVLATAGLSGIVYGLIEAAVHPWGSGRVLAPLLLGLILLPVFALWQRQAAQPLVPLYFLQERTRVATNTITVLFYTVFLSQFFVTALYLQQVLGFGALRAGLGFLPFGIAVGAALGGATALIPKVGLRPVLVTGLLLTAAGALAFTRITADGSYLQQVLPASVLIALGSGLCLPAEQRRRPRRHRPRRRPGLRAAAGAAADRRRDRPGRTHHPGPATGRDRRRRRRPARPGHHRRLRPGAARRHRRPGRRGPTRRPAAAPPLLQRGMSGLHGCPDEAVAIWDGLAADNSHQYWQTHRDAYARAVDAPTTALVEAPSADFGPLRRFRPHRDVRPGADRGPTTRSPASPGPAATAAAAPAPSSASVSR